MDNETLVYKLLARGLLDIRIAAHANNSKAAFALADLFHNVPYQIDRIRKERGDYLEIINGLRSRADEKKLAKWLEVALGDLT